MRSFLIRDILSGPANTGAAGGGGTGAEGSASGPPHQASTSAFECAAAQSLAATQARFLAKLAEHQQQIQASKYYEQLQQQHHQLLNLNLSHHHLQQLQQQQLALQHQHHQQPQPQQQSSGVGKSAIGCNGAPAMTIGGQAGSGGKKTPKTSSFAYDCASPISSISDVERAVDDEEEDDEEEDLETEGAVRRCANEGANDVDDENDDDEDDDEEEEIEVEKLGGDELEAGGRQMARRATKRESLDSTRVGQQELDGSGGDSSSRMNSQNQQQLLGKQMSAPFQLNSPLDALFQMTSSTFDALKRGEKRKDRDADQHGSTNFTNKQTSKKKRKSRTAFTNIQIYELEQRFRMQKYLSPTDRDEIALTLNLSNAQVITWFQNRRAKLKRDLEEQKRDIETASLLNLHKTFLESFQALSQMKTAIKPTDAICRTGGTNIHGERDLN